MANEFVIKNGFHSKGDSNITGSLIVSSSNLTQFQVGDSLFYISGSGNIGIGTQTPTTKLHVDGTISGSGLDIAGNVDINGNTTMTGSLQIYKSGSTVFNIEGSQGTLFSVTDELSGSLFSVNDISGIPIFEVFSDNTLKLGTYNAEEIIITSSAAIITGSFTGSFAGDGDDLVIKRIHLATSQSATIAGTADYQQWDVQLHYDSDIFEHSTVTNSDNIAVRSPGLYHVISTIGVANNTTVNRLTATGKIRVNGSAILHTIGSTYHRGNTYAGDATIKINSILNLSASDVVDIEIITDTFGGGTTVPEWSELHIYKLGTST